MKSPPRKTRALGLCSGGLDSTLSGLVLREQGIEVEWITFETPFFAAAKARKASQRTGIPLTVKSIFPVYIKMLKDPNCGYGRNMNPCLDCHALMFRLAGEIMQAQNFDFLFSGEVLGQRPMSQTRSSLRYVEKKSGFEGYILRPLSAKRLPETIPEKEGLVRRERLFDFAGRSRKPQIKLAQQFGLSDYPAPAGGCLLTDKGYSRRLKDLFAHQENCTENELHLLKYGRHFRLNSDTKLIVGRTQIDNENIIRYHNAAVDTLLDVKNYASPVTLVPANPRKDAIYLAAAVCVGYSKAPPGALVDVLVASPHGRELIQVIGIRPQDIRDKMI
ncbi:MAG: tRNA 4-thiouridine(8) synthase ThiI [Desulfobacterales bacterium]|nr:MAG: tRNA 4-thiouridine(8) synthase ThiI [Desulfobacterales bacterium]